MSIRTVYQRDLEWELIKLKAIKILGNGNKIKEVAAQRSIGQMVTVIGESSRMAREKDLGFMSMLMGPDTPGNGWMMTKTATEYKHGLIKKHIMESGRMACSVERDISGGLKAMRLKAMRLKAMRLKAMSIGESMWMESNLEKESNKRMENSIKSHIKKTD
jgi:hypothetical protein